MFCKTLHTQVPLFILTVPIKRVRPLDGLIRVSFIEASSTSSRTMKIKFLVIIFATIIIAAQCRSVTPPNAGDVDEKTLVNTPKQLKELISSYEEYFAKLINFVLKISKNKDNNEQEIQFLNRLTLLIEEITKDLSKVKNMHAKLDNDTDSTLQASSSKPTMRNVYNVKDLINTIKEIDIVYQNGEITDEHIRIKRATEGYKDVLSFATSEEQISDMLDIQRQLLQIRKCLDKLCKKHHLTITSEVNSDNDISSVSESNKVSIT
ncbi:uncharacterized protein [Linepithema humile]|uniref:uncharacterized protein isoform X2 n=1 Tax=Linepithema humile TaxID=83485 RepID=UPI0006232A31|nr:PREDICTED: uncharacterized protein LOC105670690 [Linepithema humile]